MDARLVVSDDCHWAISLQGDGPDLDAAVRMFRRGGSLRVCTGVIPAFSDRVVILCSDFNALDANDDQGIHMAAAHLVDLLNGALFLDDPARRPLNVGAVHRRHANGEYGVSIALPAISITLRGVSAVGSAAGEEMPHDAISWLRKGMDDGRVSDVLAYMRADPGWFELYKVVETIQADIGAVKSGVKWHGSRKLKDFGRDAQLERHSRQWCKRQKIESSNAMALSDARRLVREFVVSWLNWKQNESTSPVP